MHIRACTRRPIVCLPSARRRPAARGLPRWVHPPASEWADSGGDHEGPGELPETS